MYRSNLMDQITALVDMSDVLRPSLSSAVHGDKVEDLCNPNTPYRDRSCVGPGSLSMVANEITDILPRSDDDIKWSLSQSLLRAFVRADLGGHLRYS